MTVSNDYRRGLLMAALGYSQLPITTPPLCRLHIWLDSWAGLGLIDSREGAAGLRVRLRAPSGRGAVVGEGE